MADSNLGVSVGTDAQVATELVGGNHVNQSVIVNAARTNKLEISAAGAASVDGSGVTQPISAAALPLPAGAATAAAQLPDGHNVTVDNGAGAAAVNIQDGGNSITVDGSVSLTGTGSVNVAQFGGSAVATGGGVSGAGVPRVTIASDANDAPVTERGIRISALASAAALTPVSADGDMVSLWSLRNGQLVVQLAHSGTLQSTGAGVNGAGVARVTLATDDAAITSLQLIDDVVFVDNAAFTDATSKVAAVGFFFDDTLGTALTENDIAAPRINAQRAVVSAIEDGATRARYATVTAANALKVDGSAVTQPVSGNVTATLAAGTNTNEVVGDAANDAAIAGNPLSIGGRASIAIPTAAGADGRNFYAWLDLAGAIFTRQRPAATSTLSNVASSATSVTLLAANNARIEAFIMNDSTSALMIKLGATASATSFTKRLAAGEFWAVPQSYRGVIDGIWQAVQGNARMTELTS